MDYISQLPIHFSKVLLKCVLNCYNFTGGKVNGYMFNTSFHRFNTNTKHLVLVLTNKRARKGHITNFRKRILILIKKLKIGPIYFFQSNMSTYAITITSVLFIVV